MTDKNIAYGLLMVFVLVVAFFMGQSRASNDNVSGIQTEYETVEHINPADKVEVVNFYGSFRCWACQTLGDLTKSTIEDSFSEEIEQGRLVYREINGELPENREIATKYQARGSSLYINAIRDGRDDIREDVTVWRLIGNQAQLEEHLKTQLNQLLGKS